MHSYTSQSERGALHNAGLNEISVTIRVGPMYDTGTGIYLVLLYDHLINRNVPRYKYQVPRTSTKSVPSRPTWWIGPSLLGLGPREPNVYRRRGRRGHRAYSPYYHTVGPYQVVAKSRIIRIYTL